ncbi:MAG: type II secretion system GspH family protein [Acetobacter sp.]|nr:type II secretion system GspH family protein [Acetobacter sp.]
MRNQSGRSMVEMLGVLAIVGILSVGGIAGYSKAMTKYNVNKLTDEFTLFLQNIQLNQSKLCKANSGPYTSILTYLKALDLIPDKWKYKQGLPLYDSSGNRVSVYAANTEEIQLDYYLYPTAKNMNNALFCKEVWIKIIKPNAGMLQRIFISRNSVIESRDYGENYCNHKNMKCISDATISDIIARCKVCTKELCILTVAFK